MYRHGSARLFFSVAVLILAWFAAAPAAHDIPNDVTVQAFLKPDGQRLRLLMRVPLGAMRDMDYPKPRGTRNTDLLDLSRAESSLRDASTLWLSDFLDLYENDEKLGAPRVAAVRASLQSDKSFATYDEAVAHLSSPGLPETTEFFWSQGLLDVMFEYPIHSDRSKFSIQPRLARLGIRTLTVLRFLPPGGGVRSFEFLGDPGLVRLDPGPDQAARQFFMLGFRHILAGTDHLLFLACLVIPFRRFRPLVLLVTGFTVAHAITMIAAAYGVAPDALWFPPLVETMIATAIVYLAVENIVSALSADSAVSSLSWLKRRWLIAVGFGLLHGFGFSFGLRDTLQFAGSHVFWSMLSFNAGLEVAQLAVVAILIPVLGLVFRYVVSERTGTIVLSALVAHTAWHWMEERWELLRRFTFEWPALDAAFLAGVLRWMMLLVATAGLYWVVFGLLKPRSGSESRRTLS